VLPKLLLLVSALKKIFKDEGIDIADDLTTLVDGKIGVDDALAILDLVVGTN
jgi:hypothetical protein